MRQRDYEQALEAVVARTRRVYPEAPFGIAVASACSLQNPAGWEPVRAAQRAVAARLPGAFLSADSDAIPAQRRWRYDGCHFSAAGARWLASQYREAINRLPWPAP
ncbi:hypothetical protein [Synechococcus sp. GFB01]|uniref:hypothetical protein n=1 Tax=Synechococcus sp. GFB01 TaxID=1662190 RepID=UPI00064F63C3|nr:hypothetical protein [Synechococcus sp. GFB01]KMM17379.1 hypothetical protein SYNGFB01_04405 [Synechococcus sp. GFB01]